MKRGFACVPVLLGLLVLAGGCTVGPKYQRASVPTPAKWEAPEPWRPSEPKDAIPKGQWWNVFHDDELEALEAKALEANQSLKAAAARYQQARALTAQALSALYPQMAVEPQAERQRLSGNRPTSGVVFKLRPLTQNAFALPFTVNYEADLFGGRRRNIEASEASLQASAADLENVRLIIAAELASDYFALRQADTELGILDRTVLTFERGLQLVQARHAGGIASGLDVAQEEALLETTRTQAALLHQQRDQLEHAIAVLAGQPAPEFHVSVRELPAGEPPAIDAGLPSDLLERRPDVAETERQMAAANAQIGVARSAYFPSLNLFGTGGWQSKDIAGLLNAPSLVWAVGATATEAIFTGGARRAQVQFARAGYDATVANYRNSVFTAFQEVEDDLSGLRVLNEARTTQERAVAASRRALDIATNRYVGGLVNYLDVVSAQQTQLNNERQLAQIRGQRLVTSVLLIKALGGGWDASSLAAARIKPKVKDAFAP